MINKPMNLNNLSSIRMKGNVEMNNHVAQLKSQFSKLAAIGSVIEKQMKVAIFLSTMSEQRECALTIASVYTI